MARSVRTIKLRKYIVPALYILVTFYVISMFFALLPFARFFVHPFKLLAGEKNYLVLLQNNYELRPTGGFISSFGILTIKSGIPRSLVFEDVYGTVDDHPYVTPPEPLGKLLGHPTYAGHTFRDANLNPHFPAAVRDLEVMLARTRPQQKIDGVIAVDVAAVENLLAAIGSVRINGTTFDAAHLLENMEHAVTDIDLHDLEARASRKDILKTLASRLFIKSMMPWNTADSVKSFKQSLENKNVLMFFKDETLQNIVEDKKWGGVMQRSDGEDFLAVVDANYGGGKSNRYVKKSIFAAIDLEKNTAEVEVRYDHPADYNLPLSTDYRAYLRAYVPDAWQANNVPYLSREGNLIAAGKTLTVPVHASAAVRFAFELPDRELTEYRLVLWKQPGTRDDFYHITVKLPGGMNITSRDFETTENIATFRGSLTDDRVLTFEVQKDRLPPRIIEHQLHALDTFEIFWNEELDSKSLDIKKWKFKDGLVVDSFNYEKKNLTIFTRGMTDQPEKQYVIEMAGVRDITGNQIKKKTLTFYQRL